MKEAPKPVRTQNEQKLFVFGEHRWMIHEERIICRTTGRVKGIVVFEAWIDKNRLDKAENAQSK